MNHDIMTPEGYAAIAAEMNWQSNTDNEYVTDGKTVKCGWKPPDKVKYAAHPRFGAQVITKDKWKDHSLRPFTPAIYDQNPQSSCTGHGSAAAFGTAWALAFPNDPKRFAPCFIYGLINGGSDNGASTMDTLEVIRDVGVCLESTVGPKEIWSRRWSSNARTEAARYRGIAAYALDTYDQMVTAILLNKPVVFGIFIGGNFEPGKNGLAPRWDGRQSGGHCMYGAEVKLFPGESEHRVGVPNSWGTWFGDQGWSYMDRSYFDSRGQSFEAYAIEVVEVDPNAPSLPVPGNEV